MVFRARKGLRGWHRLEGREQFTYRNLTEYAGLDDEAAVEEHYHEALDTSDRVLKRIFKGMRAFETRLSPPRDNSRART